MATSTARPGEVGKVGMLPAVLLHPCACPGEAALEQFGSVIGMEAFLPSILDDRGTSDASYIVLGNTYVLKGSLGRWYSAPGL